MKKYIVFTIILFLLGVSGATYYQSLDADTLSGDALYADEEEVYVYETEVDGPQDCASFEVYDAEQKVCSFECRSEEECSDIEDSIDEEFASWTDELEKNKTPIIENNSITDAKIVATYAVNPTENILLQTGVDDQKYRDIWNSIKNMSPDALSNTYIETYEVFNEPNDDTLAFVDDEDGNGQWRIGINLAGYTSSTEAENKTTIIHELGHIISLNTSQVNPEVENCPNLKLQEGCANATAAINAFWHTYWKGLSNPAFDESTFVTEYATTDVTEDFAETFAFFVLGKESSLGDTIKDQKIRLFYSFPELVAIREEMREALSKGVIRKRSATVQ
ncbi:MAG: hypothetical protein WAX38_02500 [Minisyncoccia bacterium]